MGAGYRFPQRSVEEFRKGGSTYQYLRDLDSHTEQRTFGLGIYDVTEQHAVFDVQTNGRARCEIQGQHGADTRFRDIAYASCNASSGASQVGYVHFEVCCAAVVASAIHIGSRGSYR